MGITKLVSVALFLAFMAPTQSAVITSKEIFVQCVLSEIAPIDQIVYKIKAKETDSIFQLEDGSNTFALLKGAKGLLRLAKSLRNDVLAYGSDNTAKIVVILKEIKNGNILLTTYKIEFIVLREGFADPDLEKIITSVASSTKLDNIFRPASSTYPIYKKLHRILLQGTKRSKRISKAQCNFQVAFVQLVKLVRNRLKLTATIIKFYVGAQGMLSAEKLQELIEETGCIPEQRNPECGPETIKYRTFDGTCNNLEEGRRTDGAAETGFNRFLPPLYFDPEGLGEPARGQPDAPDLVNPSLAVSQYIVTQQKTCPPSEDYLTHMFMQWGQFLDHDMTLAPESEAGDVCEEVPCNGGEEDELDQCHPILPAAGRECIRLIRSAARCPVDGFELKPREQINVNTAYVDASMVYGSSKEVADALRDNNDRALLDTSGTNLLPIDNSLLGEPLSLCQDVGGCFLAGDNRVNEQAALAMIHTVFVREHNRLVIELRKINRHWNQERLYQEARRIVGALVQQITYKEWLPIAIGPNALRSYKGYNKQVNAGISNAFATATFRFGHSLIRPTFDFLNIDFTPIAESPVKLRNIFFNNTLAQLQGIDGWARGMFGNNSCEVDNALAEGLIFDLFRRDEIQRLGLNLAALNIQRGREHGLPFYSDFLAECQDRFPFLYPSGLDLSDVTSFDQIKDLFEPLVFESIKSVYGNKPQNTDLWPAGIGETATLYWRKNAKFYKQPENGPLLGPTFTCLMIDQFERLRDGDRFFYENYNALDEIPRRARKKLAAISDTCLSSIICSNVDIVSIPRNAFVNNHKYACTHPKVRPINLRPWREAVTSCSQQPCLNGGTCRSVRRCRRVRRRTRCQQRIECHKCKPGFNGRFCHKKI